MRRRSMLAVAALAAAALGGAPGAPAAMELGAMDPAYQLTDPAGFRADVEKLRPAFLRYDVYWNEIAPTRPRKQTDPADPAYQWATLDALVTGAAELGYDEHRTILTIWRTPRWAYLTSVRRMGDSYANLPKTPAYASFARAVAERYSGTFDPDGAGPRPALPRVQAWELGNEPNFASALRIRKGKPVTGRQYAGIVRAAYAQIKAVHASNVVAAGALYRSSGPKSVGPVRFMQGMKPVCKPSRRARNRCFDVLSVHPYPAVPRLGPLREGVYSRLSPAQRVQARKHVVLGNFAPFSREVTRLWGPVKIWITEYGWQTQARSQRHYSVTQKQQALYMKQAVDAWRKRYRRVTRMTWFLLKDERSTVGDRRDTWQSGVCTFDGKRKLSYGVFARLTGAPKVPAGKRCGTP